MQFPCHGCHFTSFFSVGFRFFIVYESANFLKQILSHIGFASSLTKALVEALACGFDNVLANGVGLT